MHTQATRRPPNHLRATAGIAGVVMALAAPLAGGPARAGSCDDIPDHSVLQAAITVPGPPTDVTLTPKRHRIKVRWHAPSSGPAPTGYQVRISGGGWTDANGKRMTVKGLESGHRYTVRVRSCIDRIYSTIVKKHTTTKG